MTSKLSIISLITLIALNSYANKNCDLSQFENPLKDIQKIDLSKIVGYEKAIAPHYKETESSGIATHDLRHEIEQTTLNKNDPAFALYASGMVFTNESDEALGTGIMISPCHMLTANHVIESEQTDLEQTEVRFDFSKNPNGLNFRKSLTGTVAASSRVKNLDYAIVKLKTAEESKTFVKQCDMNTINSISNYSSLSVGYPQMREKPSNPNALYGMKARIHNFGDYLKGYVNASPRDSGGAILTYTEKGFCVSGIKVEVNSVKEKNSNNFKPTLNKNVKIASISNIFAKLYQDSPELADQIAAAQTSGSCK